MSRLHAEAGITARAWPAARTMPFVGLLDRIAAAPLALLAAPLVILAGLAILAWDYAILPPDPIDHVLYWVAIATVFLGVAALGTAGSPRAGRQLLALAVLGGAMWLPYLLRSPDRLLFVDELYHRDVLARILETGHAAGQPVTLFPLPGTFPGLEIVAAALVGAAGVSMDTAIRMVTLAIHALIPCVAYLAARGVRLGRRGAFIAAVIYVANTSFPFFHSVFSYETLGILLFLTAWALIALYRGARGGISGDGGDRRRWVLLGIALPVLAAIAVTHHVSSYVLAVSLVVAWLGARIQRAREAPAFGAMALVAIAAAAAWFVVSAERVGPYLWSSLVARVETIVATIVGERAEPRVLFANADQPQLERLLAFSYPPLVLVLSAVGLWIAWQHRARSILWLPLALLGPIAWVITTPAVFTRAGELAYRSWPFLFLGVAVFAALGLLEVARRAGARWPSLARPIVVAALAALLFGGISIGENQAGRFPTAPTTAAGGAANTPDVVAAASWLKASAGPGNVVATDVGTAVAFATEGRQEILRWAAWYPFVVGDPSEIDAFVRETGVQYVVLDRRITALPPRYGTYFGAPPIPDELDPGGPVPADLVATLDEARTLARVYVGPNLVIWRVDPDAPRRPGR